MYKDNNWVIPCITGRGTMCIGIFPSVQVFIIPKSKSAHLHIVTQEDGSGPGPVDGSEPGQEPPYLRPGEKEHNTTTTRLLGSLGSTGWDTEESPLQQREQPDRRSQSSKVRAGLCIAHVRKKGEKWKVEGEGGQQVPRTSPLQIWHITLKRPQACVRIDNENALEKRERRTKAWCFLSHLGVRWLLSKMLNRFLPNRKKAANRKNSFSYVFFSFFLVCFVFSSPVSISILVNKQSAVSKNRSAQPTGQVLEELWEELNVAQDRENTACY